MNSLSPNANGLDAAAVQLGLQRVLASEAFSNAHTISDFLRYVVECRLERPDVTLKEYTIAVEVFGRGTDFDSDVDTIVRVSARRLRARLALYYETTGRDDPVWISMPKGHYCAEITVRAAADTVGVRTSSPAGAARPHITICVIPFANLSNDPEQQYFSDGITDDIITDLSKVAALGVTSPAAARGRDEMNVGRLARELGVSHVLSGSVRRDSGRVRISVRLTDAQTGNHVWAERYDRDLDDILALTGEISQTVVNALKLELLHEEKAAMERHETDNLEAHNIYLMARQIYVTHLEIDARATRAYVRLSKRAVELDPNYAQAWALLAMGQRGLHELGEQSNDGMLEAERALALDPGMAEAYAVRAYILQVRGALDEAVVEARVAMDLNRDSYEANRTMARLAYQLHRFDEAVRYYEKATALMEADLNSAMMLVSCHHAMDNPGAAHRAALVVLQRADKVLARDRTNPVIIAYGANALAALGEGERAKARMHRALLLDPDNWNMRYNFACAMNLYLKDGAGALDLLDPLLDSISPAMLRYLTGDPDFATLRDNARFQAMLARATARHAGNAAETPVAPRIEPAPGRPDP
ncbi:MAG TPA: hypothetical protein VF292_09390 [Rhodanobacteraceae bacterium]